MLTDLDLPVSGSLQNGQILMVSRKPTRDIIYETGNGGHISPGAPVFDTRWNLLGLQIGTINPNRRAALRIEMVVDEIKRLCNEKNSMACKVLDLLKSQPRSFLDISQG